MLFYSNQTFRFASRETPFLEKSLYISYSRICFRLFGEAQEALFTLCHKNYSTHLPCPSLFLSNLWAILMEGSGRRNLNLFFLRSFSSSHGGSPTIHFSYNPKWLQDLQTDVTVNKVKWCRVPLFVSLDLECERAEEKQEKFSQGSVFFSLLPPANVS